MVPAPGCSRRRKTRPIVRTTELVSRLVITVGGIGTILAVTGIMVFLLWVVIPLFRGASVEARARIPLPAEGSEPVYFAVDEYGLMSAQLFADGLLRVEALGEGRLLWERRLFDQPPTACSFAVGGSSAAIGFSDGRILLGQLDFASEFVVPEEVPEELRALPPGRQAASAKRSSSTPTRGAGACTASRQRGTIRSSWIPRSRCGSSTMSRRTSAPRSAS